MASLCISTILVIHLELLRVTGGAGYIGSRRLIELLARGHDLFFVEHYANRSPEVLIAVQEISGNALQNENIDITDELRLE